ncbi:hypothetical protein Acr_10g0004960 [Actinidia rufa]|uniref:Uncharacterized protein n=1 Tax=Actinidia rufa TaxID=165716 RepID=A0A7J0F8Y8_9ERIC|nr:hypothetical protein Acr_10g0004960 [Actinidia rufa]
MASACRSAVMAGARRTIPCAASRIASVLGSVDSMMPLHSAIASARLKSNIAIDSTCWSWLSQGISLSFFVTHVNVVTRYAGFIWGNK